MRKLGEIWNVRKEPKPEIDLKVTNDYPKVRPTRFSLASGSRPLDGFTIRRGVGIGGFGEVYYATSDAGKDVALKRIQRNLDIEVRGVTQCLNLKHPNLVALYDIRHDSEDQAWVVMEFVAGDNLQEAIGKHPAGMPMEDVLRWWDGITAGVGYLHDCGIVHRDLKPGNIFLDGSTVKIGDYGLSKFISCSRRSGQTQSVGTFHYMAPEIGQGRYGKEIDIYALGIMLYEMITGSVPFDGESSQEIIMKHLTAEPALDGIASPYKEVIQRSLAKDPSQRFESVHEMRSILPGATVAAVDRKPLPGRAPEATAPVAVNLGPQRNGTHDPAPAAAMPPSAGPSLLDEPVARAFTSTWRDLSQGWSGLGPTGQKIVMGIVAWILITNARTFGRYLGIALVAYMIYLAVRAMIFVPRRHQLGRGSTIPSRLSRRPVAVAAPLAATPRSVDLIEKPVGTDSARRKQVAREMELKRRQNLASKSGRQRAIELCTSLFTSALIVPVLGLLAMLLVISLEQARTVDLLPNFLWLSFCGTIISWGILTVSKFWEAKAGDDAMRRFVLLLVGLGAGSLTFGLARLLNAGSPALYFIESDGLPAFQTASGDPLLPAYLTYFGGLLCVPRWWKQADPIRRSRLSVMGTVGVTVMALVLQAICPIPGGFVMAAMVAIAVQLAATWAPADAWRIGNERKTSEI